MKVGDAGPLLDMMAANLEKLSVKSFVARSTIQAVSVLALAVAYLPDHLHAHQVKIRITSVARHVSFHYLFLKLQLRVKITFLSSLKWFLKRFHRVPRSW